jgi:hypothetical protein
MLGHHGISESPISSLVVSAEVQIGRLAAVALESGATISRDGVVALESDGRVPSLMATIALESSQEQMRLAAIALDSGLTSRRFAKIQLESILNLPISESATIVHRRRLLAAFFESVLHERTILATAPPFPLIVHTRSIFRSFLPMIHRRTIVPRSVILNAGLIESGQAQGGTLTTVILAPDSSSTTGFYVGMWITIDGEVRQVITYIGGTRTATVAALSSPPIAGTPYSITVAKPGASKVLRPFAEVTEA